MIEALEASQDQHVYRLTKLQQENGELKEEVSMLRRRLSASEQNVIQLESEKAQLEFLQTLPCHDSRQSHSTTSVRNCYNKCSMEVFIGRWFRLIEYWKRRWIE